MLNKQTITQQLLKDLDYSGSLDQALQVWWQDFRGEGGMRLTEPGYNAFEKAWQLEKYVFNIPPHTILLPRQLITLNRKLQCPYYIKIGKQPQLILYDTKQAVMLALYGEFNKFLDYLEKT